MEESAHIERQYTTEEMIEWLEGAADSWEKWEIGEETRSAEEIARNASQCVGIARQAASKLRSMTKA